MAAALHQWLVAAGRSAHGQAHVQADRNQHDDDKRDRDRRAERPVPGLQEQIDQRIADKEYLAATEKGGNQEFTHQQDETSMHPIAMPGMESGRVTWSEVRNGVLPK